MHDAGTRVEDRVPYVILYVEDMERSARFYQQELGLTERTFPVDSQMGGLALAIQGTTIVLLDKAHASRHLPSGHGDDDPRPGHSYISFAVPNLENFHNSAVARGVDCVQPPRQDTFGNFAVYRDPDRMLFSIVEAKKRPETHAVVLSGGGALGAFQLGVLSRLADDDTQPDPRIMVGTSVGGFNAAVLAAAMPPDTRLRPAVDHLIKIWRTRVAGGLQDNGVFRVRGDMFRAMDPASLMRAPQEIFSDLLSDAAYLSMDFTRRLASAATSNEAVWSRMLQMIDISSLVSTEPLQELIKEFVSYEQLRKSACVLKLAATDWKTGRLQLFAHYPTQRPCGHGETGISADNAHLSVLASAAIPALFPPVTVPSREGAPFVDGGVVMNSPLNPAIDAGADVIHLICLNPDVDKLPLQRISSTVDVVQRLLVAVVAANVTSDLDRARFVNSVAGVVRRKHSDDLYRPITIHRYHPAPGNLGGIAGLLDFDLSHIDALIQDGINSAKNHDCEAAHCVIPGKR